MLKTRREKTYRSCLISNIVTVSLTLYTDDNKVAIEQENTISRVLGVSKKKWIMMWAEDE